MRFPGNEEVCDGIDINCDLFPDGFTDLCETTCGIGEKLCLNGKWLACDAPSPIYCQNFDLCGIESTCAPSCLPKPP